MDNGLMNFDFNKALAANGACRIFDIVTLTYPDGRKLLKGEAMLKRIAETGVAEPARTYEVAVRDEDEAAFVTAFVRENA